MPATSDAGRSSSDASSRATGMEPADLGPAERASGALGLLEGGHQPHDDLQAGRAHRGRGRRQPEAAPQAVEQPPFGWGQIGHRRRALRLRAVGPGHPPGDLAVSGHQADHPDGVDGRRPRAAPGSGRNRPEPIIPTAWQSGPAAQPISPSSASENASAKRSSSGPSGASSTCTQRG